MMHFAMFRPAVLTAAFLAVGTVPSFAHELTLDQVTQLFETAQLTDPPSIVDCTLSGGTETQCFKITVKPEPADYTPGPWCPRSVSDDADVSGIWLHEGEALDADGAFMERLAKLYSDGTWEMVNPETGQIRVTDSLETCAAAARPDVTDEYRNYCVECLPEYMPDDTTLTFHIPIVPQRTFFSKDIRFSGAGLAINGIRLDAPAPVDAILGAYTIAPFDDCGGHVNLHVGYHYHAVTDCLNPTEQTGQHAPTIGLAMDGHLILSELNADGSAPDDLDKCNGHESDDLGFHYHAGSKGSNAILGCVRAEYGCVLNDPDAYCDASKRPARP